MDYVWKNLFSRRSRKTVQQALKEVELFNGFTAKQLKLVEEIGHIRRFKEGEAVFSDQDPAYGLFIVLRGAVKVTKDSKHLSTYEPFDFFGEFAMVDGSRRNADAVAVEDSVLFYLYAPEFKAVLKEDPYMTLQVYDKMLAILAKTVDEYSEILCRK